MKMLTTPISEETAEDLHIGDMVLLSGRIYCGRDAVLPKICKLIEEDTLWEYGIDLRGSVIFHTAVSPAGVGPTSSNSWKSRAVFRLFQELVLSCISEREQSEKIRFQCLMHAIPYML